uniref:Hemolysin XhlA n=1 Tax=Siphoviridae sp. ctUse40 TaxID=2826356 RepID=A0A8S5NEF2_9CAUD|nr:MAG TPA: hemolysin XhlA [Siphoviridae sp. ctUse40]
MERNFESEVLTRLTKIETKLDDYNKIKEKIDYSYSLSKENEKEIEELKDKIKWISRTIAGAIITGIAGIIFLLIQLGAGLK